MYESENREQGSRALQQDRQVLIYQNCTFDDNEQAAVLDDLVQTGVLTVLTPFNDLFVLDCTFQRNIFNGQGNAVSALPC